MAYYYLFYIIILIFIISRSSASILWVPLFTILVDIVPLYFTGNLEPAKESIVLLYFRGFTFLLVQYLVFRNSPKASVVLYGIPLYLLYLVSKQFFTMDVYTNIKQALLLLSYIIFIPAAFSYASVGHRFNFNNFRFVLRMALIAFVLNTIYCTLFVTIRLENNSYGDFINSGAFKLTQLYGISYILVYLLAHFKRLRWIDYVIIFTVIALLMLIAKRTPIIILFIGILIIVFFNWNFLKYKIKFKHFLALVFLVMVSYYGITYAQKNVRARIVEMKITEENRFREFSAIYIELVESGDWLSLLTGHPDSFTARLSKSIGIIEGMHADRNMHSDIAVILFSTGLLGLIFYSRIFYFLISLQRYYRKSLPISPEYVAFWALSLGLFANFFADSHTVATSRAIPYILIGLTLGLQKSAIDSIRSSNLSNF